jgi:hypothetical protein
VAAELRRAGVARSPLDQLEGPLIIAPGVTARIRSPGRPDWYTARVASPYRTGRQPVANEIRVDERDGRRLLQQWRLKPDGCLEQYEWVDIAELAPLPPTVRPFGADR